MQIRQVCCTCRQSGHQTNLQGLHSLVQRLQLGFEDGVRQVCASSHAADGAHHSTGTVLMLFSSIPQGIQPQMLLPGSAPMLQSLHPTKNVVNNHTCDSTCADDWCSQGKIADKILSTDQQFVLDVHYMYIDHLERECRRFQV